jgi:aminodeoxyfutalosine deaminase
MTVYRARWVLPIAAPPIDEGWVAVDGGRVAAVGAGPVQSGLGAEVDLGRVALLPALVNAHTHLELSYLAGARATGRAVHRLDSRGDAPPA